MVTVSGNPNPTNPTYPTNPTNPNNPTTKCRCKFVNLNCIYTPIRTMSREETGTARPDQLKKSTKPRPFHALCINYS